MTISFTKKAALFCVAVLLQSCASNASLYNARSQFYSGNPNAALVALKEDNVSERNRLLAHLDHGLIAHTAGNYQESVIAFKAAYAFLQANNLIKVSEQSASLVTNDWATTYKGEYSERLWIHTFQMMNFLLLGKAESAAVEARQALQIYDDHGKSLRDDWFSRTLIAQSFEAAGKLDSAHIEYKKALNDSGIDRGIALRAWRNANKLDREQDAAAFKKLIINNRAGRIKKAKANTGELVLFIQSGIIPRKSIGELYLGPGLYSSFPIYPAYNENALNIALGGGLQNTPIETTSTELVDISRSALAARGKQIAAKLILRLAAKKQIADQFSKRDDVFGDLLNIAISVSEVADIRSWETLPAYIAMVQIPLDTGTHNLSLRIRDGRANYKISVDNVNIRKGRTSYRSIRVGAGAPQPLAIKPASSP